MTCMYGDARECHDVRLEKHKLLSGPDTADKSTTISPSSFFVPPLHLIARHMMLLHGASPSEEEIGRAYASFVSTHEPSGERRAGYDGGKEGMQLPTWLRYELERPKEMVLNASGTWVEDDIIGGIALGSSTQFLGWRRQARCVLPNVHCDKSKPLI
jgi:hypothetical protein